MLFPAAVTQHPTVGSHREMVDGPLQGLHTEEALGLLQLSCNPPARQGGKRSSKQVVTAEHYIDSKGKKRYKGTAKLKGTETLDKL